MTLSTAKSANPKPTELQIECASKYIDGYFKLNMQIQKIFLYLQLEKYEKLTSRDHNLLPAQIIYY